MTDHPKQTPSQQALASELQRAITTATRKFSLAGNAVSWDDVDKWHAEAIDAARKSAQRYALEEQQKLVTEWKAFFHQDGPHAQGLTYVDFESWADGILDGLEQQLKELSE